MISTAFVSRFRVFVSLCIVLCIIPKCFSEISTASNQFGLKLYTTLAGKVQGDFMISPFPLSTLFGLLSSGADGNTLEEIRQLFEFVEDSEEIAKDFKRVLTDFQSLESLDGVTSQLVLNETVDLLESFENSAYNDFSVVPSSVDFSSVDDSTDALTQLIFNATGKSLNSSSIKFNTETSIALMSTSYFKGSWLHPFNLLNTKPSPFFYNNNKSNQVDMMFQRVQVPYADIEDLDCTAVALPYRLNYTTGEEFSSSAEGTSGESRIELIILLPNSRTGLKDLEEKLKSYTFSQITRQFLEMRDLFVYLPKFSIDGVRTLNEELSEMGLNSAFNPENADFSKMVTNNTESVPLLSDVFQFGEFTVDELGSHGIASSITSRFLNYQNPESFRVNKPFIGFVYDQERHIILNIFRKTSLES